MLSNHIVTDAVVLEPPVLDRPATGSERPTPELQGRRRRVPWWLPGLLVAVILGLGSIVSGFVGRGQPPLVAGGRWWAIVVLVHLPFVGIVAFLAAGLVERVGSFWRGRALNLPGEMPPLLPTVCVQLPMFNEDAVAQRSIEAACALDWPRDRLIVQVLDDSTDAQARRVVDDVCARMRNEGVDCRLVRREQRDGYKAGALEAGRRLVDSELIVIFDADFLPEPDFLRNSVGYFFDGAGAWIDDLALVQAQWGHLNHDESALTKAQSLWVDDHHTVQMSWRSQKWGFVNFTGTAGVWRADAIERAGGWRAASLVEDCELSFRHLFAGYRTRFVKEVVAPAELPATYTAYKAQQKRWTQGWVQLQRLHLRTLLRGYRTTPLRRMHLLYHMCIPWQWALWGAWLLVLPIAIWNGIWLGAFGPATGLIVYVLPMAVWLVTATVVATIETRHTYRGARSAGVLARRMTRIVPYVLINTGMLPHQWSAFNEGLFGSMHSEFERTPKAATITAEHAVTDAATGQSTQCRRRQRVRVHRPYVAAEVFFVTYQTGWAVLFALAGLWVSASAAAFVAACVVGLMWFYGDHDGRRLLVIPYRPRRRWFTA